MKKIRYAVVAFLTAFVLIATGCTNEVEADTSAPAEIRGLAVSAKNGNADLRWTNPEDSDFAGVKITMTPAAGSLTAPVILEKDVTSLSVSGLTNGNTYEFKLQVFDASLNYSEGVTIKATVEDAPDKIPPAPVTNLVVTAKNGNAVLTWQNPEDSDFAGVKITMTPAESTLTSPISLDKNVTSFSVSGLTIGNSYEFKVQAFDTSLNYSELATASVIVEDTSDKTAPESVTDLTAKARDRSVLLTWTDAVDTDQDIYGYEVTWTSTTENNSSNSMIVGKGLGGVIVHKLMNGTEYTFSVRTLDTSFNKADAKTATATPVEVPSTDAMKIALSVPEEKSNTTITVTANITTEGSVKRVVFKQNGSINAATLLADTDAQEATEDSSDNKKWLLTISATNEKANGTYTVAAIDSNGREEIEQIVIDNFDFIPPANVTGVTGSHSSEDNTITLNWKNPTVEDFDHVEICYTINDGTTTSEKSAIENIASTSKTYTEVASPKIYTFYFTSVDKLGNKSNVVSLIVRKTDSEGFVVIPKGSIKGTERWSTTSKVFVSGRDLEIASFYMCDHEVTQDEFMAVMGTNPSKATTDGTAGNNPVNTVSWYDAIAYCNKLSVSKNLTPCYTVEGITDWAKFKYSSVPTSNDEKWNAAVCNWTANGYRLPTEAEWEWAARGGKYNFFYDYDYAGSNKIGNVAWYSNNSSSKTHEVKTKAANTYGLYDMSGNVREWCWDWYSGSINTSIPITGPSSGSYRVIRGGCWYDGASSCTVSSRDSNTLYARSYYHGFRVVRSAQ